jgi:hypothetical protein
VQENVSFDFFEQFLAVLNLKYLRGILRSENGIVSKPIQKPVDRLTLFQGISQVLSRCKTT